MRNVSFRHIETLQAIAEAGSLVQAAAALNMTPAALTARVKGLEETVGLKLFDRAPTGMRLTPAGEAALEASRGVGRAIRDFAEAMHAIATGEGGRLSVGATSTAKYFAPRLIAGFVASRPKVDLRFLIGNRDATVESFRAGEIEVALSGRPPRDMPVETFAIGPHPYVLIAPPDHRLAGAKGLTKADLAGEAFLFRELVVRQLHWRHGDQTGSDEDGAGFERNDKAGRDGGARHRPNLGAHNCGRGRRRATSVP
jgi:DNA-binding transcriptional LysR family regulator